MYPHAPRAGLCDRILHSFTRQDHCLNLRHTDGHASSPTKFISRVNDLLQALCTIRQQHKGIRIPKDRHLITSIHIITNIRAMSYDMPV